MFPQAIVRAYAEIASDGNLKWTGKILMQVHCKPD
jgi:hypothetical protein